MMYAKATEKLRLEKADRDVACMKSNNRTVIRE
jgi:hypothetical protein